jgi:hypothetical protein
LQPLDLDLVRDDNRRSRRARHRERINVRKRDKPLPALPNGWQLATADAAENPTQNR